MLQQKSRLFIVLVLLCLVSVTAVQASDPYTTQYMGHHTDKTGTPFQYTYVYESSITHHAFTFEANAGEVLTLSAHWVTEPPPAGFGDPWQPSLIMTPGTPSIAPGQLFPWDLSAAVSAGNILPRDMNNRGQTLEEWEVPTTGIYTLYIQFYPYRESSGGIYAVSIQSSNPAPAETEPDSGGSQDWMGEFTMLENGDHFTIGSIDGNPSWRAHSFTANPGDLLSVMVWNNHDSPADQLKPRLVLCEGGCTPADPDPLAVSQRDGSGGIAAINYQVPSNVASGTLHTVLVNGGGTTGGYSIWMRQWTETQLADQVFGGWMGELGRTEAGNLHMDGVFSSTDAFKVHSFRANPGDIARVNVRAKRDTPADRLTPVVLLVPGGYEPGEQWLTLAISGLKTVSFIATIPDNMPPDTLYTVVVADISNVGQLLYNEPPVTGQTGGYAVFVMHLALGRSQQ